MVTKSESISLVFFSFTVSLLVVVLAYGIAFTQGRALDFEQIWIGGIQISLLIAELFLLVIFLFLFGSIDIFIIIGNGVIGFIGIDIYIPLIDLQDVISGVDELFQLFADLLGVEYPRIKDW